MRFLHISDLHFGKSIHGMSLYEDQKVWIGKFINLVKEKNPDAILVAGDVYDKAVPSAEATELLDLFLTEIEALHIPTMLIAGNHDSSRKLSYASSFFEKHNIYISGILKKDLKVVKLEDEYGPVNFWLLPYVYPALAQNVLKGVDVEKLTDEVDGNEDVLEDIAVDSKQEDDSVVSSYEQAVRSILEIQNINTNERNVIVAHQNVVAAGQEQIKGGSETTVGGSGQVSFEVFDDFDYAALGHIHAGYAVGKDTVRYAGTPMCYHFDETKQDKKGPLLVTINKKGQPIDIERLYIESFHPLREIRGTYDEVCKNVDEVIRENEYIKLVLTDRRFSPDILAYFKAIFDKRNSFILDTESEFREFSSVSNVAGVKEEEKSIEEYFEDLYRERKDKNGLSKEDSEFVKFIGDLTRIHKDQSEDGKVSDDDVTKLLDFIMNQEDPL